MIYLKKYMIVPTGTTEEDQRYEEGEFVKIVAGESIEGEITDLNDFTVVIKKSDGDLVGIFFEDIESIIKIKEK